MNILIRSDSNTFKSIVFIGIILSGMLIAQAGQKSKLMTTIPGTNELQTATTHPMKYYISLPKDWSTDKTWPVLFVVNAHYPNIGKTMSLFASIRDSRELKFIIVVPMVISTDPIAKFKEYSGDIADSVNAADTIASDHRDFSIRTKFDSEGIRAIMQDVQKIYHGRKKIYIAGFSSSTQTSYLFIFNHPELLEGAVINCGIFLGRGVDESNIPYLNSPERAKLKIKRFSGEADQANGASTYTSEGVTNWRETKAKLIRYGHQEKNFYDEVIKRNNPDHIPCGHNWYPTLIFDFFESIETSLKK